MANVEEEDCEDEEGDQRRYPGQNEHDADAEHRSKQGHPLVVIAKPGTKP